MATNREIFNGIAESWYRLRHHSRFQPELSLIAERWHGGRLLNVGCAHGPDFLPFHANFDLWGLDFSKQMIQLAGRYAEKYKFDPRLVVADAVFLPFLDDAFDYVIAVAAYHHIKGRSNRIQAFNELKRVLKPGGEIFLTVWNRWQARFWLSHKEAYVPWKSKTETYYRYHHLYSYSELSRDLTLAGFKVIRMFPEQTYRFPVKYFSQNICVLAKAI